MNKNVKTLLSLLSVAAISTGVLFAADWVTQSLVREQQTDKINTVFFSIRLSFLGALIG